MALTLTLASTAFFMAAAMRTGCCADAMAVFGIDFGHTVPQWVLPYGGRITVDGPARRITAHY